MQNVLSLIRGFLGEVGANLAPEAVIEEDRYYIQRAAPRTISGQFYEIPDKPGRSMALQLFQTGKSRTFLIGKIVTDDDVRPVHYASVASVVLSRHEGSLAPYTRPLIAHLLLLDLNGLDEDEVVERYSEGIEIINTNPEEQGYKARRIAAMKKAMGVQREMMEEGLLALKEDREPGVVIVVDGSIAGIEGTAKLPGLIGLIPADAEMLGEGSTVLNCPFRARSALDDSGGIPAFYLRVRDATGMNPDFGLIRVELGLNPDGNPPDEVWASDVSSLLLKERFPVDRNAKGWDKSIFALLNAGKYIDTLIPRPGVVTTYFGRSIT